MALQPAQSVVVTSSGDASSMARPRPAHHPAFLHCRHDVGNLQRVIFVYSSGMMRRKLGRNERLKIHACVHVISTVSVRIAASKEAGMRQAQGS